MNMVQLVESGVLPGQRMARGVVDAVAGDETSPAVRVDGIAAEACWCDVLVGGEPLGLAPGDAVLVWHPGRDEERPVVLGRIGPSRAERRTPADVPDELVIEARKSLTLHVGDGSITIREDGKILIKGRDVVSHARRMNRIRGGAVAIN